MRQTGRLSLTNPRRGGLAPRALCRLMAAEVIVFVSDPEKAPVLAKVLDPANTTTNYPVHRVRPRNGIKHWMLDAAASASIGTLATESSHQ